MMSTLLAVVAGTAIAFAGTATAQQMYRYVDQDGKVVYTDRAPPPSARNVEQKNLRGNVIETSELPLATREAQRRNPVSLYVFECGEVCDKARGVLNRRGVPHAAIETTNADNAERLKKLTGSLEVPVLQVGSRTIKGFNEAQWQAALDQAGYPKTPGVRAAMSGRAEQMVAPGSTPAAGAAAASGAPGAAGGAAAGSPPEPAQK